MVLLNDKEVEGLRRLLATIEAESRKKTQVRNKVTNNVLKAKLILKKAERRQQGTLELY